MSGRDLIEAQLKEEVALAPWNAVATGELLALADEGSTPIVRIAGRANAAAVRARTVVDLHGAHIGSSVVLVFEEADPQRPIVMGVLRGTQAWPLPEAPAQVEVDADGERMLVSARSQLVLRCGKASITLTKAGKVLIQGSYVSSRSSGVNRVKGGSVQLN
ncbi:hypothetical protein J2W32_005851 [Variovorax boronicumulans]|jgi:hypothetical protein|uniref:DUF6484 domain-containing protein n=1 Tax=Variovorax boronicumulans TaxID=436515 RepID=A0AAW8DA69_9BURK|nr:DUF6484 domain-containing protein [Variovorax boronicumulans]MDP9896741.1 hypothetical protein [Variovorax boronicumulans]MDQ0056782.1 hypothetical protein [Variovorax boronicumulans]